MRLTIWLIVLCVLFRAMQFANAWLSVDISGHRLTVFIIALSLEIAVISGVLILMAILRGGRIRNHPATTIGIALPLTGYWLAFHLMERGQLSAGVMAGSAIVTLVCSWSFLYQTLRSFRQRVNVHEIGHALVFWFYSTHRVEYIDLSPANPFLAGGVKIKGPVLTVNDCWMVSVGMVAGEEAERLNFGAVSRGGGYIDLRAARKMAAALMSIRNNGDDIQPPWFECPDVTTLNENGIIELCRERARMLLASRQTEAADLLKALSDRNKLSHDDLQAIIGPPAYND